MLCKRVDSAAFDIRDEHWLGRREEQWKDLGKRKDQLIN